MFYLSKKISTYYKKQLKVIKLSIIPLFINLDILQLNVTSLQAKLELFIIDILLIYHNLNFIC